MSILEFIAAMTDKLAWPVTVLILAVMAKRAYESSFEDEDEDE